MPRGIIAGGNWIRDSIKVVERWPRQDTLATILRQSGSNGGSPYNILVDLAHLGAEFPLAGIGLVGDDDNGRAIRSDCRAHGIDTRQLRVTPAAATSFTDVVTVQRTGRRTFFHQRGANALLDVGHFDFAGTQAKIFHLGYLLLLDRLDAMVDGWPASGEVLRRAKNAGLVTSVDCVSEGGDRFPRVVAPVLPWVDYLFANDFEAEKLAGISIRRRGRVVHSAVMAAAAKLLSAGVGAWVILHFPEAVFAASATGRKLWQPSVRVSPRHIAGAAGAGDALAAGVLFGVHEARPMEECLQLGVCAAAACITDVSCSAGIGRAETCLERGQRAGYRSLPGII